MSQVFVGNPTLLHREFQYRVPGHKTIRTVKIPAGGQEQLPDDLSGTDLAYVVAQLERYGGVPASDLGSIVLPKSFIFDVRANPIPVEKIEEGLERDEMARQEVSGQVLEDAGLGAFKLAEDLSKKERLKPIETSIEIVEMTDKGKVKDGVNVEFVTSKKPGRRAGRKRTEDKN